MLWTWSYSILLLTCPRKLWSRRSLPTRHAPRNGSLTGLSFLKTRKSTFSYLHGRVGRNPFGFMQKLVQLRLDSVPTGSMVSDTSGHSQFGQPLVKGGTNGHRVVLLEIVDARTNVDHFAALQSASNTVRAHGRPEPPGG